MANKKSDSRLKLLEFEEVKLACQMSFGSKKSKVEQDFTSRKYQLHEAKILQGIELLVEYMGMNPSELVRFGMNTSKNASLRMEAINKMQGFYTWLIKEKGYAESSAKTNRGNAMSLFKWNGCPKIPTKNSNVLSEKKKSEQLQGIDEYFKLEIIKKLFNAKIDMDLKCFIALALSSGHRISDMRRIEVQAMRSFIEKGKNHFVYSQIDEKREAFMRMVLGPFQQEVLKAYLETIPSEQVLLFGDESETTIKRRIYEKLVYAVNQIHEADSNIITPHTFRHICKTVIVDHGWSEIQANQFTGHKDGTYTHMTDRQLCKIFKTVEETFYLGYGSIGNGDSYTIDEYSEAIREVFENKGKREGLTHLFHERKTIAKEDLEALDRKTEIQMLLAASLDNFKEGMYQEFKERMIKDLNLNLFSFSKNFK